MPIETSLDIMRKVGTVDTLVVRLDDKGVGNAIGDLNDFYSKFSGILLATTVDGFIFTNYTPDQVYAVYRFGATTTVVGGAAAAVQLVHCAQSVAIASGTAQLTAALDLTVTAPAKLPGTLIATPTEILPGDSLGLDMSGTLTGLVGAWTLFIKRKR